MELQQAVDRFFKDLDSDRYDLRSQAPEFCIQIIEKTICHQQGEKLDGTPLRGTTFLLEPFHKFIIYNLLGFYIKGTNIVRFHEALIFIPRKKYKNYLCCFSGMGFEPVVQEIGQQSIYHISSVDAVTGKF